jgi:hypothetical protein
MMGSLLPLAASGMLLTAGLRAQESPPTDEAPPPAIRLFRAADGTPQALQTGVLRYRGVDGRGPTVDLVGAVHLGDAAYYEKLQRLFEQYDAVLFELVRAEGAPLPTGEPDVMPDPFSMLVDFGLSLVDLASQTDAIDYRRPNFIHADLSPARMWEAIEARGDDSITLTLSAVSDMLREQNLSSEVSAPLDVPSFDPFALLTTPGGPKEIKRLFASQIAADGGSSLGRTLDQILIQDRNEECMRVLRDELGTDSQRICIFYGAAHLPDFHRRLTEDFGMRQMRTGWITAWDLR